MKKRLLCILLSLCMVLTLMPAVAWADSITPRANSTYALIRSENVGSGLIVGSNGELRPCNDISRAETATVILRLLQKAELVDIR